VFRRDGRAHRKAIAAFSTIPIAKAKLAPAHVRGTMNPTPDMRYRRAIPRDYPEIVRLNEVNFIGNLAAKERSDGFLSAIFTERQVAAMAEDLGITVALVDGRVVAFLCAFRNDFDHGSPVVAQMLASYGRMWFEGKLLSGYRSYVYGPVCIDRLFRRRGVLRRLYEAQKQDLAGRFDIGVALIARDNVHSLDAHVGGLGMIETGDFDLNGQIFATVAFRLP
jgi:hypothetical protein